MCNSKWTDCYLFFNTTLDTKNEFSKRERCACAKLQLNWKVHLSQIMHTYKGNAMCKCMFSNKHSDLMEVWTIVVLKVHNLFHKDLEKWEAQKREKKKSNSTI